MKTKTDRSVSLPVKPAAVAVAPDGLTAAVAYDAHVSWVDLQTGTIKVTCDLSSDAYDVTMSSTNVAYVLPKTSQWISLHAVDLTTCTETLSNEELYAYSHVAIHPSGKAVFAADQGLSPDSIDRCDLTVSPIVCGDADAWGDWGTYAFCGNLWMSEDGKRVYTACGVTLDVPDDITTTACTYGGKLDAAGLVRHLSEAPLVQKIVSVADVGSDPTDTTHAYDDTVVAIHESAYLGLVSTLQIPGVAGSSTHGQLVFSEPDLSTIYVITAATSGTATTPATGPFAIQALVP